MTWDQACFAFARANMGISSDVVIGGKHVRMVECGKTPCGEVYMIITHDDFTTEDLMFDENGSPNHPLSGDDFGLET